MMTMPHGYYLPSNQMFLLPQMAPPQSWPPPQQPVGPFVPQPVQQWNSAGAPPKIVKGPPISNWLWHCDLHPDHEGKDFSSLTAKFYAKGFRNLLQLTSGRTSIEKLSNWLGIGKGTSDLIIGYTDEDIALVHEGTFSMNCDASGLGNVDMESWT